MTLTMIILSLLLNHPNYNLYPLTTTVVEVNVEDNYFIVEDYSGNLWEFTESEDWEVGDICSCIMSDSGTREDVTDDVMIDCRYNGNVKKSD